MGPGDRADIRRPANQSARQPINGMDGFGPTGRHLRELAVLAVLAVWTNGRSRGPADGLRLDRRRSRCHSVCDEPAVDARRTQWHKGSKEAGGVGKVREMGHAFQIGQCVEADDVEAGEVRCMCLPVAARHQHVRVTDRHMAVKGSPHRRTVRSHLIMYYSS